MRFFLAGAFFFLFEEAPLLLATIRLNSAGTFLASAAGRSYMHLQVVSGVVTPGRTVQLTSLACVKPGRLLHEEWCWTVPTVLHFPVGVLASLACM